MYREIITKYQPHRSYLPSIVVILTCTFLLALIHPEERHQFEKNNTFIQPRAIDPRPVPLNNLHRSDAGARSRRLPNAIIIGARKCGTRALVKFLEINPVVRSASREVHFFDRDENYEKGLDWYRRQMPETDLTQITLEKSPAYFVTRGVPHRVQAMNPRIKLIVILRDPVTRLISDYSQLIANRVKLDSDSEETRANRSQITVNEIEGSESQSSIWKSAEMEFRKHILTADGRVDEKRRLIRTGMYSMHLERWLALFRRDQFHFVNGEGLIMNPHVELQKLESFLGIQPTIRPEHFVFIAEKGFYCISGRNVTISRPNDGIEPGQDPICLSKSKGRRHISVDEDLKNKLREFYAPYNEYLSSLIGINFY